MTHLAPTPEVHMIAEIHLDLVRIRLISTLLDPYRTYFVANSLILPPPRPP